MRNGSANEDREGLSTHTTGGLEARLAQVAVLASAVFFICAMPFAGVQLPHILAFIPAYQSALVISDLITAILLFGQFNVVRSRSLLILGGGYLFTACIAIAHTLSYPDLFSSTGLLGAGPQSTAWLYMFWRAGFPLFVTVYALSKNKTNPVAAIRSGSAGREILAVAVAVLAVVCALTLFATVWHGTLPVLMDGSRFSSKLTGLVTGIWILSLLPIVVLWWHRPHTVLDRWLIAVMVAWFFDIGLGAVFNTGRFDFGFYAGRIYGLLASNFLLAVLLIENGKQYTRVARMEGRYRGLLEAAPDAMVVVDPRGEIVLLNVRAEEQFGYSRDELIGQKVTNIIPEGFAERLLADERRSAEEALAQQIGSGIELYGQRRDGTEFPIEIMLSPLESSDGLLITAAIRDISVRKAAEEHVTQMEGRYRGLLEAAPDAMVVVDQGGAIVLLNVRAETQFGYSRDELIGQNVENIIPEGFAERLIADGARTAVEALAQQIGSGIELYGRRRDGSDFPIEIMLSPLESSDGLLVTAAIRDISVRKAAEAHVTQMEGRYRGLLEAAPDAMVVVDQAGAIVLLNVRAETQFGYSRDELIGQNVQNIIPEGFAERLIADGARTAVEALAQQIGSGIELYGRRRDGSDFPIEIMLSPLESSDGLLVTAAIRDISVRKAAEEHLAQMEARYRGLLEAAPDAMVVVNQTGEIVLLNVRAEEQFGYSRDELIRQKVENIIPKGFAERLVADGLRSAEEALAQQIGSGIELYGRRRDGSGFPIEIMLSPLDSADGLLVTAAIRDISVRKAAEEHLAQMEGRYRGLLEAAPDAMVVVNQRGAIVLLNVRAETQFGYSRDELIAQNVTNIIPEGFAERLIADGARTAVEALAQQIGSGIELYGRRRDGSDFPIEIMLSPLESSDGLLVTAAIRDISVRKAAEEHLAQMEGRYRGLLEAAPDAMVVVDQAGAIVLLNVRAETEFGYSRDELIGQNVKNIIPEGFAERLIADGARTAVEALAQQIGSGIELYGRRRDGSDFPIEIMLSPLESSDGLLVTAAIRDISVRKVAEKHLAQMEGRYRGLLEAAPDAMVVVDQEGAIVLLNVRAETEFGYSRDELIGQKVENIVPEGFAERLLADGLRSTEEALAQGIGSGIELYGRRRDGSNFPIEIMLSPLDSADGFLVTAAIRDISVRKTAEALLVQKVVELNRSNKELEQFAYIASHDLQEPLRMVASYTQLLSRRYKGKLDSDGDEFIAFAVDGANRMQRLIQDLLAYSRIGTQGKSLLKISSEDALRQALMNLHVIIKQSGAQVTHDPLPAVLADEMQLIQLFQNLVGNAIKYQRSGIPSVHISAAETRRKRWMFSVRDNGLGIDSQYFEKIFGMFQRLHRRDEFAGTGMGLAICKKIVERHGGSISVESQPGEGSTFRFALAEAEMSQ
jgi:PAS domain S-box-containing protein